MKLLCEVFRSPKKEGMYLFVKREEGLARVPETLLAMFGSPESALVFALESSRKLALADAATVLAALESEGFYVQMPPGSSPEPTLDPRQNTQQKEGALDAH
ncbi:YcgL domain-containing protein [Congregibacter sp.]|uniref:YcgL domain-containing protein n=1 Tax=Congregibacter sp. TaxID=2744308 RepID=UPI00385A23FE